MEYPAKITAQPQVTGNFLTYMLRVRVITGFEPRQWGIWSKSPIPKSPFTRSPFAKKLMLKRALFIGNQLGLVSVYMSVESDKKSLDWF